MKPLNLQEFAESLLLGDHREFATEILDNLDFVENSNFRELCEDIARHSEKEFKCHNYLAHRHGEIITTFGKYSFEGSVIHVRSPWVSRLHSRS